jgi:hypothetical protein
MQEMNAKKIAEDVILAYTSSKTKEEVPTFCWGGGKNYVFEKILLGLKVVQLTVLRVQNWWFEEVPESQARIELRQWSVTIS